MARDTPQETPLSIIVSALKVPYIAAPLAVVTSIGSALVYRRHFRRIPNAEYVTPVMLGSRARTIKGVVTSVGDADNFRLFHTPGPGWGWLRTIPSTRSDLKDNTLHIRIAGVDAPELPHFGNPGQPFGQEALKHLKGLVEGKKVKVQLLSKDRYSRIVGMVHVRRWPISIFRRQNVSLAMTQAGLATVYRASGAEHGNILAKLERAEAKAKRKELGMWSQTRDAYVSPADYKRQHSGESV